MTRRSTFMHKFPAQNFGSNRDLLISQYCCTYEVNGFVGKWAEQREKYENVVLQIIFIARKLNKKLQHNRTSRYLSFDIFDLS